MRLSKCPRCLGEVNTTSMRRHPGYADGKAGVCAPCRVVLGPVKAGESAVLANLPEPSTLPLDYLIRCVQEATRRRDALNAVMVIPRTMP